MKNPHIDYLHLFVLVAFAVAQPIYDLLGKNPEFFVAHSAKPALIITMIVILSFGLATVLVLSELLARLLGKRVRTVFHWLFVFSLTVLIFLPLMKRLLETDYLTVSSAILLGGIFTALYVRLQDFRMFITILLPVVVVFPILFLWGTPVGRLVVLPEKHIHSEVQIENPVTTIVVIFDEFSTTALLDREGQIDEIRFPNFANLAAESLWFPNAVSASQTTVEAIPSIVTGRNPRPESKLMPTVADYPDNLFTMLGPKFALDVTEEVTALCPQEFCAKQNNISGQHYFSFFSDLLVFYSQVIAPSGMAKKLPSIEARWTGFGGNLIKTLPTPDLSKKDDHLAHFISQIKASTVPTLYFIHTELPHIPYSYLASGQQYSEEKKLPEGIISDKVGWIGEEPLIVTAYSRYLQQVGYVDNFLGKLKKQLILANLYDDSLIIITADHGVAFEAQQSRRRMTGINNSEIFKVPMIVKLPKQKHGRIEEKIVSSIDVLPTIIDVLEVNVSWKLDGFSMVTDQESTREGIDFVGLGHLNTNDIVGFPRLDWQIEHFGEHTPLDRLVPKGPFNEVAGQDLNDLRIGDAAEMLLISDDIGFYQYVSMESNYLPSLFRGYVKGADERNLPIAIAVNGHVWATTNTSEWDEKKNYFSVLFPEVALKQGQNIIKVYLIQQSGEGLLLRPINENRKNAKLQRTQAGPISLVFDSEKKIIVETSRNNMDGYLDWLTLKEGMLVFEGWAADLVDGKPATDILIFEGDKLVWQVEPAYRREGVVKAFNRPTLLRCGFRAIVPVSVFQSHSADLSVVAISKDKRAFKLHLKDIHKTLIHTTLVK